MRLNGTLLAMTLAYGGSAGTVEWQSVDPAELALKAPRIQKDADAEVIFWDVRVEDQGQGLDSRTAPAFYLPD